MSWAWLSCDLGSAGASYRVGHFSVILAHVFQDFGEGSMLDSDTSMNILSFHREVSGNKLFWHETWYFMSIRIHWAARGMDSVQRIWSPMCIYLSPCLSQMLFLFLLSTYCPLLGATQLKESWVTPVATNFQTRPPITFHCWLSPHCIAPSHEAGWMTPWLALSVEQGN